MSASRIASTSEFYVVGGTMRHDAPSYVERQADRDLFDGLSRGRFCYVLTSRQMGKSSLMVRTAGRLREAGVGVAVLDLTAVGQNLSVEQWYAGLMLQLGLRLDLEEELIGFWESQSLLGPLQRWMAAMRTIILPRYPGRLVIFIDEIDSVRGLPFRTDEFFAGIRECHNLRGEDPAFERLTFCLLGVATPADLIRDTRTTPFNIGLRIELRDFTETEAVPLARGLGRDGRPGDALLRRILHWSGGHPFLTQRLCQTTAQDAAVNVPADVDRLCDELFFTPRARERDDNLLFVRERILRGEEDLTNLLELYGRVRRGRRVMPVMDDEANPLVSVLRLSGITRAESGRLRVRNRIYEQVFDRVWIAANLPEADEQRRRAAFRRGVAATAAVFLALLIGGLAFTSVQQRRSAAREAEERRGLLYLTQMKNAWQEWRENSNVSRVVELLEKSLPASGQKDPRGFEWYQLWHLTHGEELGLRSRNDIVAAVYSPDGRSITVVERRTNGGNEYLVGTHDAATLETRRSFSAPAGNNFNIIAFSPDGRRIATDNPNREIAIWELSSGNRLNVIEGSGEAITAIAFSPDGRWLVVADMSGTTRLLDAATGRERWKRAGNGRLIFSLIFSPNGGSIVVADGSTTVRILAAPGGNEIASLRCGEGAVISAGFSPSGDGLLTSAADGTLHLRELRTQRVLAVMKGHGRRAQALAFSPDGKTLATGSEDRTVKLWSAITGKELATICGHGSTVRAVSWSRDGKTLATGGADGAFKLWNVNEASETASTAEPVASYLATAFSREGTPVAFGLTMDGRAKVWNPTTGAALAMLRDAAAPVFFRGVDMDLFCAAFSPDGRHLATGGNDKHLRLWDATSGQLVKTLSSHTGTVQGLAFSPDGKWLISGGEDRRLLLWDVAAGSLAASFQGGQGASDHSYRATFSPDGELLATANRDGGVTLWDVATRRVVRAFRGHDRTVRAIAFSRDGALLATGGEDGSLRIWEVATGREPRLLGQSDSVMRLAFTPDGKRLISGGGDGAVKLWDVATGQEVFTLIGHADQVTSITFAPDGKRLVTAGIEGSLRFWRAATESEVANQAAHRDE